MLIFVDRYGYFLSLHMMMQYRQKKKIQHNKVQTGAIVSMEIKTTSLFFELRHERTVSMNMIVDSKYLIPRFAFQTRDGHNLN